VRRRRFEPCAGFAVSRLERAEIQASRRAQLVCDGSEAVSFSVIGVGATAADACRGRRRVSSNGTDDARGGTGLPILALAEGQGSTTQAADMMKCIDGAGWST
jgi:hypothetical protein